MSPFMRKLYWDLLKMETAAKEAAQSLCIDPDDADQLHPGHPHLLRDRPIDSAADETIATCNGRRLTSAAIFDEPGGCTSDKVLGIVERNETKLR